MSELQRRISGARPGNFWYHVAAFAIVAVWGTSFVSTKVLLNAGLSPQDIFFYRFVLAYAGMWCLGRERLWADSVKDEFGFALLGIAGGSLYFLAENVALQFTLASNVALLVSTAPIMTGIVVHFFSKNERLNRNMIAGSLVAFIGVGLVIFNGNFILAMNPAGDLLSIAAAVCWAFYTIIIKGLAGRYSANFITRKVFFYGIITLLPVFLWEPLRFDFATFSQPVVWGNLLFLGVVASLLCFLFWNKVLVRLGAIRTTNYVYFSPPVTLIASAIVIAEPITWIAVLGAAFILTGVYMTERY